MKRDCAICGETFTYGKQRELTAKYCSRKCAAIGRTKSNNSRCTQCGSTFRRKPSHASKVKYGSFCSYKCWGDFVKTAYKGDKNPNYKHSGVGSDGYRTYVPSSNSTSKERKLHRETWRSVMGIDAIPEGIHVHHRDCNVLNNNPENLVGLTRSDHVWLHKQYGNATLWAVCNGKIDLNEVITWSDDQNRARRIIALTSISQSLAHNVMGLTVDQVLVMDGPVKVEFIEVVE